jgi:hypothetical protein
MLVVALLLAWSSVSASTPPAAQPVSGTAVTSGDDVLMFPPPPPAFQSFQGYLYAVHPKDVELVQSYGFRIATRREALDWQLQYALAKVAADAAASAAQKEGGAPALAAQNEGGDADRQQAAPAQAPAARQVTRTASLQGRPGIVVALWSGFARGMTLDLSDLARHLIDEADHTTDVDCRAANPGVAAAGTILGGVAFVLCVFRSRLMRWWLIRRLRKYLGYEPSIELLRLCDLA